MLVELTIQLLKHFVRERYCRVLKAVQLLLLLLKQKRAFIIKIQCD